MCRSRRSWRSLVLEQRASEFVQLEREEMLREVDE
jgi:hypothetical protein